MAMGVLWTVMALAALLSGAVNGTVAQVGTAALTGANEAIRLCISMTGAMCLWSGVMELLRRTNLDTALSQLFRPILKRLLPRVSQDPVTLGAVSGNLSANLLGLGNAATPLGICAATRMARRCNGTASDELCRLVVLNTASIQLLPTTVAALRASCGSQTPFDILPAVWLCSASSVAAGLAAAWLFGRLWR